MAECNPYNEEVQNGIRLCALLLEVGTDIVRALFDLNVSRAAKTLPSLLSQKRLEMQDYKRGTRGKPRLLTGEQYDKMYPGKKRTARSSETFDITLLILLNSILCKMPEPGTGWAQEPNPRDLTKSADLVRLRLLRNSLYGHTFSFKMSSDEYEDNWSKLTDILLRLGASEEQCEKYSTAYFQQEEINNLKDQLYHCIAQDISQFELVCSKFLNLFETSMEKNKISISQELTKQVDKLIEGFLSRKEEKLEKLCAWTLSRIVNLDEAQDILYETFVGRVSPQLKQLSECLETVSSELMSSVKEVKKKQEEIKDVITNINITNYHLQETDAPVVTEIYQQLSGINNHFKILIVNEPQDVDKADIPELATALGRIEWDVIVDLDHNSRSTGIHDQLARTLKGYKDFSVLTYNELRSVKDDVKNGVARGNHCLYILANGCSETANCGAILDKFGKANMQISRLLDDILVKLQEAKPLLCKILLLSEHGMHAVGGLQSRLNDAIESNDGVIAVQKSGYLCISVQQNLIKADFLTKGPIKQEVINAQYGVLCAALFRISPDVCADEIYTFPERSGGDVCLRKKDIVPILPFLDLYHKNIGKIVYEDMEKDEVDKIRTHYHKGSVITPEGLCLSAKSQVFVRRKEIDDVLELIQQKFVDIPWRELHKQPFVIKHDASGGGSTVARVVLYELRNKYPCVLVKCIGEKLYEGLEKIYRNSQFPLVILIDNMEMTQNDYVTLKRRIENNQFKALVIKTERVFKTAHQRSCPTKNGYFVSGTLFQEDMPAFRALYSQYGKMLETERVFLYGLQAFVEQHIHFQQHVEECLTKANECQRLLMRFCCLLWSYAEYDLSGRLVMTILDASPDECFGDEIYKTMGYAGDFLLKTSQGFRPAHFKIIAPILKHICETDEKQTQLRQHTQDLITVMAQCVNAGLMEPLQNIIYSLFIKRKRDENQWWSRFVWDLKKFLENEFEDVLISLIKCCSATNISSHIKVLYSRYLMYMTNNREDDSVKLAREACGLSPNDRMHETEIDSTILANYGNILMRKVQRKTKLSKDFIEELDLLHLAVDAYKRAQAGKTDFAVAKNRLGLQYNGVAFTGEAAARYQVLNLLLKHKFHSDRKRFNDFVQRTEDSFISSCEKEAFRALDNIDYLWSLDLLNDEHYDETAKKAKQLKFDFLFLHSDISTSQEVKYYISTLGEDVNCAVGTLVRCFLGRNNTVGEKRNWNQLTKEELVFVIRELKRRISVNTLRSNFEDIIVAMIYVRCHSGADEDNCGNIDFAIMCASEWKKKIKNDHEAHFMYGILTFAKALDTEEPQANELIKDAVISLATCTNICEKHKATEAFRRMRFFIGKDKGLARIIPRVDLSYPDEDTLQEFDGRLLDDNYVNVRPFPLLLKAGIRLGNQIKISQQKPLVRFNLAFAHDMLRALNYTTIDD